uniref:Thioredoxin domain-containing protein n=1 Tax=Helicotheca tamesis TaxID=374047 RepID=A0A7S2HFI6_9STRA|mmetsp:Transcript_17649/g.24314  ORF Transcript_17649/g.24314 Transcript_17649/m.24314 type:complete len:170 (+) Transcript_17649:215-724(+)|eukprot:CAMPEP_0185724088 /NCGR_PEP_ID=MMETSP1171-20130828/671_1 /TAXON_ID=374046 /ORGANISM="Helicotheca tamensis, Strain CCMP826" /LENGTH=169 /DNA_ID=CAMNT_0028391865 /DNA_START=163 /DNA_END=672 /DNA_ORIENTATION=+
MKPDWDSLMEEYSGSATALVADVDCTTEGKDLCSEHGVRGYPTIKYGDPSALEDYKGGRDLASLKKFAAENLKPMCSPANIDLCDDAKKAEIEKFMAMDDADLDASIKEKEALQQKTEADFKVLVEGLQKTYQEAMENKDKTIEEIKNSGLGLMKAVKSVKAKKGSEEL